MCRTDQVSLNGTAYNNYALKCVAGDGARESLHQPTYAYPMPFVPSRQKMPRSSSHETPQPTEQTISTPTISHQSSPYEKLSAYASLDSAFVEQQILQSKVNQNVQLTTNQEDLSPLPSVMLAPNQLYLTPQHSAVHQLFNVPSRVLGASSMQPSQQVFQSQASRAVTIEPSPQVLQPQMSHTGTIEPSQHVLQPQMSRTGTIEPSQQVLQPQVSRSVTIEPSQQALQPQVSRTVTIEPSQQVLHPQVSQFREDASKLSSRSQTSRQPSRMLSDRVLSSYETEDSPQDEIGQVQSQGTQYYDTEILVPPSPQHCSSRRDNALRKMTSKYPLSRKQSCDDEDDDRQETMIEKLERKSLNIPEGTLVTDGMNVYYITKPNNPDSSEKASNEEVIVNIPIKGSNIVKSGETKPRKSCSSCCKCKGRLLNACATSKLPSFFKTHLSDGTLTSANPSST
ncbi:bromodomain-containing protein DDB_G0280777-like [Watersipora subatra]|uniref:bromodomain-containing protein DDB_G0280777-like n=1 Tax=Watersipora subatra TaxID=2589382 RepID=UPI00355B8FF8